MTVFAQSRMTVDEYLAWAEDRFGRYELLDGIIVAMTPERAVHAEIKLAVHIALVNSLQARQLPCHVMPDGMTVRIDDGTAFEPDALVYCGPKLAPTALEVKNPIVVVEVLSPSSQHIDASFKLAGYFRLQSVQHYLIVDPEKPMIIHHSRQSGGDSILTRIVRTGVINLDPPGLELAVDDVYGRPA